MATTIARLAAVLTTDTSQFQSGMRRAGGAVRQLQSENQKVDTKLMALSRSAISASHSFGRFGGVAGAIGAAGGPVAMLAVGFTAAAAAAGLFLAKIAQLGDAARDARIESFRNVFKEFDQSHGTKFAVDDFATAAEQSTSLQKNLGELAESTGLSFGKLRQEWAEAFDTLREWFGDAEIVAMQNQSRKIMEGVRHQLEQAAKIRAENLRIAEHQKRVDAEVADIQKDMEQAIGRLQSRAESLKNSLRTPFEVFSEAIRELDSLRTGLFVNDETFGRGITKAADDYHAASRRLMEAKNVLNPSAALERGTVAEFSARIRGGLETKRLEAIATESLKAEKATAEGIERLNNKPPIKLTKGRL